MNKLFRQSKITYILGGIILLGLFLRLYRLPEMFYYTMDEEVMNIIQRRIILGQHFPLIGSVSPLFTYLGPYFYYFGAIILWLSKLNPLGQGFFACLLGTFNIYLLYRVAAELFNRKIGLLASFFYSTSFLMVIFDRRYWHLSLGPTLSLLVLLSLYKIKQGKLNFIYLLVGALIMGFNTDYTNLVLYLFTGIAWIIFKLPIRKKQVLIALLIFAVSNLPLLAFDLRHQFLNVKGFISYFSHKRVVAVADEGGKVVDFNSNISPQYRLPAMYAVELPVLTLSRAIYVNSDLNISEQHTYCKPYINERTEAQGIWLPILALMILLIFVYIVYQNRQAHNRFAYILILSFYLIFQLGFCIYGVLLKGDVFEHYLSTMMPYLFIILALVVSLLYNKKTRYLVFAVLAVFVLINIKQTFNAYNPYSYSQLTAATRYSLSQVGSQDFSLDSLGGCYRYFGFYYPFLLENRHPIKSFQDPNYSWLYDYNIAEKHPSRVVVMVTKDKFNGSDFGLNYQFDRSLTVNSQTFGGIEVLVLDNSKGDFK